MDGLLSPADAAEILGLVPATVRALADRGQLPAMRTARGMRLFRRQDVERLATERAAQRVQRVASEHAPYRKEGLS
jgi:excisionase family DNA binding protein